MIDRKGNASGARHIFGIGNFLEISTDCDRKGKEHVINNVQACRKQRMIHQSIGHKNKNQPHILKGERPAFPPARDHGANPFRKEPVKGIINQEQNGDF